MASEIVSGVTKTNTYCFMYMGAKHMLEQAKTVQEGSFYSIISCITYCAFTLEAYFNHLGAERNSEWNAIERKIPKAQKYKILSESLSLTNDLSTEPYSTMIEIFMFRDRMAHGKTSTDTINAPIEVDMSFRDSFMVGPDWKIYATLENATKAFKAVELIVTELHKAAGFKKRPFISAGSGTYIINP